MSHGPMGAQAGEPLRGVERLEWARVTLEEAVGRLAKNPDDRAYFVAVIARYHELQDIRIPVERIVAEKQRPGEPPIDAMVCLNCLKGVATVMQHHTGKGYMCRPGFFAVGMPRRGPGRPPNPPKVDVEG